MKILIVEDEQYARESLTRQLMDYKTQEELTILQAANGREGLALTREQEPDLIFADIRMPIMDGITMIKEIRAFQEKVTIVVLSAYSDFQYMREAMVSGTVDYLLKPIEQEALNACLDKFFEVDRSRRHRYVLAGEDAVSRYVLSELEENKEEDFIGKKLFIKTFPEYMLAVMYFDGTKRPGRDNLIRAIETAAEEQDMNDIRLLTLMNGVWVLLFKPSENISHFFLKLQRITEQEKFSGWFGISGRHRGEDQLVGAWNESYQALERKILDGKRIHFACEDSEADNLAAQDFYRIIPGAELEKKIRHALEVRDAKGLEELIQLSFSELSPAFEIRQLEVLCAKLDNIYRFAIGVNTQEGSARQLRLHGLLPFHSVEDLKEYMIQVGKNICGQLQNGTAMDAVQQIEDYVNKNYSSPITMKEIAETLLYMNKDYASHLFSEKKGMGFAQYLREVRVGHAKRYLEKTKIPIIDIVGLVGYPNFSLFIRNFKKETGMTPGQYREGVIKEKNEKV